VAMPARAVFFRKSRRELLFSLNGKKVMWQLFYVSLKAALKMDHIFRLKRNKGHRYQLTSY
jgi:hypothetical protein